MMYSTRTVIFSNMKYVTTILSIALLLSAGTIFAATLDEAKSEGLIGERADGYLGIVDTAGGAEIAALVTDINNKRKAQYQRIAKKNGIGVEQVQALAGKKALEKTRAGGWVLVNGEWRQK